MIQYLTPDKIRQAIVDADYHYARAAKLLDCSPDTLRARVSVLRRGGHWFPGSRAIGQNECYEPTEDEIERATAEIQAKWPPGEHAKRARWAHCGEYEIPRMEPVDVDSRDDIW